MTKSEILRDVQSPPQPRTWMRMSEVGTHYGISRNVLYTLINAGRLKSSVLTTCPTNTKGLRLIHIPSLEALLEQSSHQTKQPLEK